VFLRGASIEDGTGKESNAAGVFGKQGWPVLYDAITAYTCVQKIPFRVGGL